ncbi:MAG: hypothetical protein ACI8XC_001560 [Gammaproteobacteria bacterium]|jgi:hypothetical protein
MLSVVKAACVLLACYGFLGIIFGRIYSHQCKSIIRNEQPFYFWLTSLSNIGIGLACYVALSDCDADLATETLNGLCHSAKGLLFEAGQIFPVD